MPATKQFDYKIIDAGGKQQKGRLDAPNEVAAVAALKQQGNVPLSIHEAGVGLGNEITIPGFGGQVKLKDLAIFARQFATMTNSGLSLLRSLSILEGQTENAAADQGDQGRPHRHRARPVAFRIAREAPEGVPDAARRDGPRR